MQPVDDFSIETYETGDQYKLIPVDISSFLGDYGQPFELLCTKGQLLPRPYCSTTVLNAELFKIIYYCKYRCLILCDAVVRNALGCIGKYV